MGNPFQSRAASGSKDTAPPPTFAESQKAAQVPFTTHFACVTLNRSDRIRLIDFPETDVNTIVDAVKRHWAKGISRVEPYAGAREMKLNGTPWSYNSIGVDEPRILMLRLLEQLFKMGWVLQLNIDVVRKECDKDSLIFRKQDPPPPPCDWLCISFDRSDKFKIIGGPPKVMCEELISAWSKGIREQELTADRLKIKFNRTPWMPSGEETVDTRRKLILLLQVLEKHGFSTYAALDIHNSNEGSDTDVLFVSRQRGWVPGMPVWHR
ncbi:hypothetical protein ACHAQH_006458 [Verticillium albo-atrum]